MSTTFRPYAPDQMLLLLPADLRAWLPEGHLAHHVSDLVDGVDLTAFYAPYAGDGRRNAPYAPRMMVKVLLYNEHGSSPRRGEHPGADCVEQRPRRVCDRPLQDRGNRPSGPWRHAEAVEFATLEWVDWFNNRRLLSSIGDVLPVEYEEQYYQAQNAPAMVAEVN